MTFRRMVHIEAMGKKLFPLLLIGLSVSIVGIPYDINV